MIARETSPAFDRSEISASSTERMSEALANASRGVRPISLFSSLLSHLSDRMQSSRAAPRAVCWAR